MKIEEYDANEKQNEKKKQVSSMNKKIQEVRKTITDFENLESLKESWDFNCMTSTELNVLLRLCVEGSGTLTKSAPEKRQKLLSEQVTSSKMFLCKEQLR